MSLPAIIVLGDGFCDSYIDLESTGRTAPSSGVPIVVPIREWATNGGARLVEDAINELAGDELACYCSTAEPRVPNTKVRVRLDGHDLFRIDKDRPSINRHIARAALADIASWRPLVILLADYDKGSIDEELWQSLVSAASYGAPIIVDPARTRPFDFYRGCWAICPNRAERDAELARGNSAENSWRPRHICQKLDADGMQVYADRKMVGQYPSTAEQPAVDSEGCGDVVLAAVGLALVQGLTWPAACKFANECAGLKCALRGTVPVTRAMYLAKYGRMPWEPQST